MKFIDLFCGIGGFHQALTKLGGTCVFASDIDEKCRDVYEMNYGLRPHGDISKIDPNDIPDFDILTGGFPCQAFSNSGHKKGLEDDRGQLFQYILGIARVKNPSFMFLENVKHIKNIDGGKTFEYILSEIDKSGYHVQTTEVSPHQFGVPQKRERVLFVCIHKNIYDPTKVLDFSVPKQNINLSKILEKNPSEKYNLPKDMIDVLEAWDEMIKVIDVGDSLSPTILCTEFGREPRPEYPQWKKDYMKRNEPLYNKYRSHWDPWVEKHRELLTKREIYSKLEWQVGKKKANDSIFNHFIQFRQSGIRVKKADYFPTLVAIVQTPILARERRYITPRECARLQSFPDSFKLPEKDQIAYKQFGNAVNVDVVHFVMSRTLKDYYS